MTNITFPILSTTNADNIDTDGNLKSESQMLTAAITEDSNNQAVPAIFGFMFIITLMMGGGINPIFFIFSPIMLLLLIGALPRKKKKPKQSTQEKNNTYAHFGQEIEFTENAIYINSNFPHEEKTFFHKDHPEIKLYYQGITHKNANISSSIQFITKGKTYTYHFWIDSDGGRMKLVNALKYLYQKEITITEYNEGRKTFLLGIVSEREIDSKVQALIDEIGEKEDRNDTQML